MAYREYEELAKRPRSQVNQRQANLPLVEEQDASEEVAESYNLFRSRFGRPEIPGILKCFATHPPLLRNMMDLSAVLLFEDGALDRRLKEMIATFISARNQCDYCADSHGFFLSMHGGSGQTVCALFQGSLDAAGLEAGDRLLLEFAAKVNEDSQAIGPDEIAKLLHAGWNNRQISEAVHIAALFAFFNRVANAFGLRSQELLTPIAGGRSASAQVEKGLHPNE